MFEILDAAKSYIMGPVAIALRRGVRKFVGWLRVACHPAPRTQIHGANHRDSAPAPVVLKGLRRSAASVPGWLLPRAQVLRSKSPQCRPAQTQWNLPKGKLPRRRGTLWPKPVCPVENEGNGGEEFRTPSPRPTLIPCWPASSPGIGL